MIIAVNGAENRETVLIVGVGLIGGSLGMALRRSPESPRVRGCDRPEVLERGLARGALDEGEPKLEAACQGVNLVVLATPVGAAFNLMPQLARFLGPDVRVTDTGSTKRRLLGAAERVWGERAARVFLGGHPMAGRERGSIDSADAGLFQGTRWILTPLEEGQARGNAPEPADWSGVLRMIAAVGARPMWMDAETHDRAVARLSHLPQLLSTALATLLDDSFLGKGEEAARLLDAGGSGVRDMTRLAASPYELWRDILMTNGDFIDGALGQFQLELDHMRMHLREREMEECFQRAAALQKELRRRGGGLERDGDVDG